MRRTAILIFVVGLCSMAVFLVWRRYKGDGRRISAARRDFPGPKRSTRVALQPYVDLGRGHAARRPKSTYSRGRASRWLWLREIPAGRPVPRLVVTPNEENGLQRPTTKMRSLCDAVSQLLVLWLSYW